MATLYCAEHVHIAIALLRRSESVSESVPGNVNEPLGAAIGRYLLITSQRYTFRWYAAPLELLRCAIYLLADTYICGSSSCPQLFFITRAIYIVSAAIWAIQCTRALPIKDTKTE